MDFIVVFITIFTVIIYMFLLKDNKSVVNNNVKRNILNRKIEMYIHDLLCYFLDQSYTKNGYYTLPENFIDIVDAEVKIKFSNDAFILNFYTTLTKSDKKKIIKQEINKCIENNRYKYEHNKKVYKEDVKRQFKKWLNHYFCDDDIIFHYNIQQSKKKKHKTYKMLVNDFIKKTKTSYLPIECKDDADCLRDEITEFLNEINLMLNDNGLSIEESINEALEDFLSTDISDIPNVIQIPIDSSKLPEPYTINDYFPVVKPIKFFYKNNEQLYKRNIKYWENILKYVKYVKNMTTLINYHTQLCKVFNETIHDIEKNYLSKKLNIYEYIEEDNLYKCNIKNAILIVINQFLKKIELPEYINIDWNINYDEESKILLLDLYLPSSENFPCYKDCKRITKDAKNIDLNLLSPKDKEYIYENYIYSLILNVISAIFSFEITYSDDYNNEAFLNHHIKNIAINGIVKYLDESDGHNKESCILSILTNYDEFFKINLANVNYTKCFKRLRGISSANLTENIAITPIISFNKEDRRFIEGKEILSTLNSSLNLALMDWKDFENLVRDLFEKEFCTEGSEVKITQSSHDGGVDAVVFDPDPIKGGKIVVQAKRYTNVVNVSAVRDLYGTVHNEGANKGILVTTSNFGADSYNFAKNKPLTLINGSQLLFLLEKYGVNARIDIKEAKKELKLQKEALDNAKL